MDRIVKNHLTVIIIVTLLCVVTCYFAFSFVYGSAASMSANLFALALFIIPCALMFVGSFVIAATASEIGRSLYVTVLVISLVTGVIAMFVTSTWLSDSNIVPLLLANSPEGTEITPVLKSPITILRDIAAFIVVPTIGCIFGAWVGSRLHPLRGEKPKKNNNKKK